MFSRHARIIWSGGLLLGLALEVYFPPLNGLRRLLVDMLALGALALAIAAWTPAAPDVQPVPAPPASVQDTPVQYTGRPPRPARFEMSWTPQDVVVPRFGEGSAAHRAPWRLPREPAVSPGLAADEASLGDLTVRAASIVGPSHRCEDPAGVREDAYRIARDRTGDHLVVAVADGVSSSGHSAFGATVAVGTAVHVLLDRLRSVGGPRALDAVDVFGTVAERMRQEALDRGWDPAETAAVLVVAVLPTRPGQDGMRPLWTASVGDVSVWCLGEAGWIRAQGDEKGEADGISGNEVRNYLPDRPGTPTETVWTVGAGTVFALVTDGVGDGLEGLPALNVHLSEAWATPPSLSAFVGQVGYDAKRFLDDRTAVTVWVAPQPPRPARGSRDDRS